MIKQRLLYPLSIVSILRHRIIGIHRSGLLIHIAHIGNDLARIENPDIWAEGHEGGIHLEVDDHVNAEDATAILRILAQKALRGMDGFGLDIFAPFLRCPKFNATRRIANILADTYDIVEEMLGVKIWILAIRNIGNWLNADDTIQGEIE